MTPPRHSFLRAFAAKLRGLRNDDPDAELGDEIQEHLQLLTARFRSQGLSPQDAAAAARRQFGNLTHLQEDRRSLQTFLLLEALWHDFRYALRTLRKSRGFAAVSILTLALGIGAATAIFSVIENVLLEPFPYKGAGRMVFPRIHNAQETQEGGRQGYTPNEVLEISETNHVFDGFTAAAEDLFLYKHGEGTDQLYGAHVTPGTFEFFGMPAFLGRTLQPADYEPGAPPVFIMRYKTWVERFGADPAILNTTLTLNGTPRTLVGIMPPRFGWYEADVLVPEKLRREAKASFADSPEIWFMVGRLKPGVSSQQAEVDLTVIANRLAKIYPEDYPQRFIMQVRKLGDTATGRFEATLYTILAAVGLLLLIACSNVANLMLARATTREKEFVLRAALGAGRARLVRLLMVESLVLAASGAALGIFIAWGGLKALVAVMPENLIPTESVIELNPPVLAFALLIAVFTPVLFGLAPALQSSRRDLIDPLRDTGKGQAGGFRGRWLRDAVVVAEVALSLTLLVGAGLLMRSFVALREVPLGLRADHVFQALLPLPPDRYKTFDQTIAFFRPLLARLKTLPGVEYAAASSELPPTGFESTKLEIAGKTHQQDWQALFLRATEEYFRVLRIDFKAGRSFNDTEVNDARKVAIVNETFARRYLPNETPIGQRLHFASLDSIPGQARDPWFEIIGVAADVTNNGLQSPIEPAVWIPYTIPGSRAQFLLVRTSQDPASMMNAVRQAVWAIDSGVALAYPGTLEQRINAVLYAGPRFGFILMTIFGSIGLILVMIGVYSVLAYSTSQKAHEIGIRMALGAARSNVLGMVIRSALRFVLVGLAIGIPVSLLLGRFIGDQLVGVRAYDPATLAVMTLLLAATAAVASWLPARRASRVDPVIALRYE